MNESDVHISVVNFVQALFVFSHLLQYIDEEEVGLIASLPVTAKVNIETCLLSPVMPVTVEYSRWLYIAKVQNTYNAYSRQGVFVLTGQNNYYKCTLQLHFFLQNFSFDLYI